MDSEPTKADLKAEIEELKTKVAKLEKLDPEPSTVSRRSVVSGLLGMGGLAAAIPYLSQPAAAQQALGAVQVGALRDDNGDDQLIVENGGPVRIPNALEANNVVVDQVINSPNVSKTISNGEIDVGDATYITVDGAAGTQDELEAITNGSDGQLVILRSADDNITVKDLARTQEEIRLNESTDKTLDNAADRLMLIYDAEFNNWSQIGFSNI